MDEAEQITVPAAWLGLSKSRLELIAGDPGDLVRRLMELTKT